MERSTPTMALHSTLEIQRAQARDQYDRYESNKEVITYPDSAYPQLAPFEFEDANGYFPEVVNDDVREQQTPSTPSVPHDQQPTGIIWGLPKRRFYLVLGVAILALLGAVAGGIAGGLVTKQQYTSQESSNSTPTPKPNPYNTSTIQSMANILSTSRLTSTNRTDANGYLHRIIFFQDTHNALISQHWDSQNTTWSTSNLTHLMSGSTTPLNPLPGTPLASAASTYANASEVHLWFLVPDNYISATSLLHPDLAPENWVYDGLDGTLLETRAGSQIAAAWQRCAGDCGGDWVLAYQDPGGDVNVANSSAWGRATSVVQRKSVVGNSSLVLLPQLDGTGVSRVDLVSETVGEGESEGAMQKMKYQGQWEADGLLIENLPPPSSTLQFTGTLMNNFTETMFLALLPNGTVTALWWGGHFTSIPSINFRGGPTVNFTAISTSEDAMFYGISNDEVLQYAPDESNLFSFVYVGRVYP
ncbi:uncharacterized protein F4822DRAFT_396925 [Hypoxylon trugodes]|uniref:uncharacterized protein n=1 Tax=Hypoxylon trugodes TaxID=326681 RepID=UPI0021920377|nr:uncharacterized protein F4822DRAFT_396925 [Hypoxylon trugodes]KAI1391496.1 hypothetical protein F4822DRAFT_396925 [Hypoxylon trugodes]